MYILRKTENGTTADIGMYDTLERLVNAAAGHAKNRQEHGRLIPLYEVKESSELNEVCSVAVDKYGAGSQEWVFVGEIGEVLDALADFKRYRCGVDHIAEEIADVEITLEQIKIIYDCHNAVDEWRKRHLDKLRRKIEGRADGSSRTPTPTSGGMTF